MDGNERRTERLEDLVVLAEYRDEWEASVVAAVLRDAGLTATLTPNTVSQGLVGATPGLRSARLRMVGVLVPAADRAEAQAVLDASAADALPPELTGPDIEAWAAEVAARRARARRRRRTVVVLVAVVVAVCLALLLASGDEGSRGPLAAGATALVGVVLRS